jgi:Flp pilus assembly protein CpaB
MGKRRLVVLVVVALLLGAIAGYAYRRWKNPTLEERAHDAAQDLKSAVEKMTR